MGRWGGGKSELVSHMWYLYWSSLLLEEENMEWVDFRDGETTGWLKCPTDKPANCLWEDEKCQAWCFTSTPPPPWRNQCITVFGKLRDTCGSQIQFCMNMFIPVCGRRRNATVTESPHKETSSSQMVRDWGMLVMMSCKLSYETIWFFGFRVKQGKVSCFLFHVERVWYFAW